MNKKASARDVVLVGVLTFALGMGLFILFYISSSMVDQMVGMTEINQSESAVAALEGIDNVTSRFDYVVFGVFIGLILALIITGWFIGGIPIFMFIYFIVIVIGVVLSTMLANTWSDITGASIFGSTVTNFPITNNILSNLPYYMAVIGFIGIVVMFAKPYVESRF